MKNDICELRSPLLRELIDFGANVNLVSQKNINELGAIANPLKTALIDPFLY